MDPEQMSFSDRRKALKKLCAANSQYGETLREIPADQYPEALPGFMIHLPLKMLRSRRFLAQVFAENENMVRLSIQRTDYDLATGKALDGITWDELQSLKAQAGYAFNEAIEIYPPECDVVNVANMRHLWIYLLPNQLPFLWKRKN